MSPKKVWSIILIVLGVFAVIGGAGNYHKLQISGSSTLALDESLAITSGQYSTSISEGSDNQGFVYREKVLSIIGLLIGISLSVIGTLTIKENRAKPAMEFENEFEIDADQEPGFKF